MNKVFTLAAGLGFGAAVIFVLSCKRKGRRFTHDQSLCAATQTDRVTNATPPGTSTPARRLETEGRSLPTREWAANELLAERIQSIVGSAVSHPDLIRIAVNYDHVVLGGPILACEAQGLLSRVASHGGAARVDSQLEVYQNAEDMATLQAGILQSGRCYKCMLTRRSPTALLLFAFGSGALIAYGLGRRKAKRMALTLAGGGLVVYGLVRRDSLGAAISTAGLGVFTRGIAGARVRGPLVECQAGTSKKEWALVSGFFFLALLVRLYMLQYQTVVTPDGVYYLTLGKNLISGNLKEGFSTFWPPLYPFLIGLSSLVFRDLEFGGRIISVLAGSILVIPVYLLIRNLYGKEAASIGAFFVTVYPSLTLYSTLIQTESIYTLLFVTGILAGLSALSTGKTGAFSLTGLVFGACYLVKPEAIGFMGLMLVLTLGAHVFYNHLSLTKILPNILGLSLGFTLLSLPYVLYLYQKTNRWTISEKLYAHLPTTDDWGSKWFSLTEDGKMTLADRYWVGSSENNDLSDKLHLTLPNKIDLSEIVCNSFKALKLELWLLARDTMKLQFIPLIGLGLFKATWLGEIYLLLFFGSTLIGYALLHDDIPDDRLLVPLVPILLCWASKGIIEFENWSVKILELVNSSKGIVQKSRELARPLILVALFLSLLPSRISLARSDKFSYLFQHKKAGLWIKEHSNSSPLVMAAGPWAAFYAGGKPLYLPSEEYQVVIEYARRKGVDYIIIDEGLISGGYWGTYNYPHLQFLLDEQSHHPELELVYKNDDVPNNRIFIFKLADRWLYTKAWKDRFLTN